MMCIDRVVYAHDHPHHMWECVCARPSPHACPSGRSNRGHTGRRAFRRSCCGTSRRFHLPPTSVPCLPRASWTPRCTMPRRLPALRVITRLRACPTTNARRIRFPLCSCSHVRTPAHRRTPQCPQRGEGCRSRQGHDQDRTRHGHCRPARGSPRLSGPQLSCRRQRHRRDVGLGVAPSAAPCVVKN